MSYFFDGTMSDALVDFGELRGVIYRKTEEAGLARPRTYIHFMDDPPRLMHDAAGHRLFIVGGSYRITPRGIEG